MTFRELLAAKQDAEVHADLCGEALALAEAALVEARCADAEAKGAAAAAHAAVRARLVERGHHTLADKDGTITVYHAIEPTEDAPNGWVSYHPVPGDDA